MEDVYIVKTYNRVKLDVYDRLSCIKSFVNSKRSINMDDVSLLLHINSMLKELETEMDRFKE